MERELTYCLFCSVEINTDLSVSSTAASGPHPQSPFTSSTHRHQVFELITSKLSVETEVLKMWDFDTENLPFCGPCSTSAHELWKLQNQLDAIQLEVCALLERMKMSVRNSAKKNRASTHEMQMIKSSHRFDYFRQQVFENSERRRISSQRLAAISGFSYCNEDNSSVSSVDNLSEIDEDDAHSGPDTNPNQEEVVLSPVAIKNEVVTAANKDFLEELLQESIPLPELKWSEDVNGGVLFAHIKVIVPSGNSDYWKCTAADCDFKIKSGDKKHPKKAMARHIEMTHYPSRQCDSCKKKFDSPDLLKDHVCQPVKPQVRTKEQQCKKCKTIFENRSKFAFHDCLLKAKTSETDQPSTSTAGEEPSSTSTRKPNFRCYICDKILCSKRALERHVESHRKTADERKTVQCEECGKCYTETGITQHLRQVHKKGTPLSHFACNFNKCKAAFPNKTRLKRHQTTSHKNEPKSKKPSLTADTYDEINLTYASKILDEYEDT